MHTTTAILSCLLLCPGTSRASEADSVRGRQMQEVEIRARATQTLKDGRDGRLYWQMEALESLPHVLGSSDPVRALQLLPGVATNNDYSSGIRIQGCEASQSLLEMDGAPVFNAAHLLGLFSTFNASHFRGMALVKNRHDAGFPNRLGGRLSFYPVDSVARQIHLDATVSFMESEGTLTLPAGRHSTLYLSGRGSYLNLLYGDLLEVDHMELRYGLQDYNLTFVHQAGERDRLRLSLYHGLDRTRLQQEDFDNRNRADWQNTAAALHWQHHAPRFLINQSLTFSRYGSTVAMGLNAVGLNLKSGILQAGYAGQAEWDAGPIHWKSGAEYHYYRIRPMALRVDGTFVRNSSPSRDEAGHEASAYLQGRLLLGRRWTADAGLRLSYFHSHDRNFFLPAPRLTLTYAPSSRQQFALHYGLYGQYLHQIPVSNGGLPVDYWTASSATMRPGRAHSLALSHHLGLFQGRWEVSTEIYYKHLDHQHEHYGSILDILNGPYALENAVIHGKGRNYGLNAMLKKNQGRLTGWIGYALAWSERRFPELNRDEWLSSSYDRRHDLTVVAHYRFNRHWSLGGDFVYASGTPYTRTSAIYVINNNLVSQYGKHNGAHLPATHRMDLALTYRFTPRRGVTHSLNLSVYNLYAHRNVLFRYMGFEEEHFGFKSVYSLCRMLPSVGYNIKF